MPGAFMRPTDSPQKSGSQAGLGAKGQSKGHPLGLPTEETVQKAGVPILSPASRAKKGPH